MAGAGQPCIRPAIRLRTLLGGGGSQRDLERDIRIFGQTLISDRQQNSGNALLVIADESI